MKHPLLAVAALVALSALCFAQSAPQQPAPPRDTPVRPAAGTAVVRGRVISAATGQPLHRVRVTLIGAAANPPTTVTDTRGVFELTDVPAGIHSLTAARAGYVTIQYGQRRPREAGRTIEVGPGQIVEDIDFALPRGAVLAGRIVDELREPAPGVRVEAMDLRYLRGRRIPLQAGIATTNDLGQFRISGLEPGTYYLRASTRETWEDDDGNGTFAYAHTFYPGVARMDQTQPVTLSTGQEIGSLDFSLTVTRASRVSGVLLNASGEPIAGQRVNLDRITRTIGGALFSSELGGNTVSGRDGSFDIRNLASGEYLLYSGSRDTEEVRLSLTVSDGDMRDIALTPLRGSSVSGSIVTDEGKPPEFAPGRVRVVPFGLDAGTILQTPGAPSPQTVRPDWTFRFSNIDGPYLFRLVGMPDEWMLKAVQLGDQDITDTPLDIAKGGSETVGMRFVITRNAGKLSGQVIGADGGPTADATIVVFPADAARWQPGTRFVKAVRPRRDGRFTIGGLPAGSYQVSARDFVTDGQWENPEFLRTLGSSALKFELGDGGSASVTLKVEPQP